MQTQQNGRNTTRNFHGQKKQLLKQQAGNAPPAWKGQQQQKANAKGGNAKKSRILLSELPKDVLPEEVVALFSKTVGPVKEEETFIVYNNKGDSRGMAIVTFQRETDAYAARTKYNGKLIDGRKPIRIEIIKDEDTPSQAAPAPAAPPSLLQRIGGAATNGKAVAIHPSQPKKQAAGKVVLAVPTTPAALQPRTHVASAKKLRQKKGPKRVKKAPVTLEQLDADMEAYKANTVDEDMS